jgi:hypothetical protein
MLRFWEGGCGFRGILKVVKGHVAEEKVGDYNGSRGG